MARPSAEHYDLSETERRDIIKLIEMGLFPAVLDEAKRKGINIFGNDTMTLVPVNVG